MLAIAVDGAKIKKAPGPLGCGGCLGEPSFRQLAAAPELISPSTRVTTTTLSTSRTIDDGSSEERVEPMLEEADMRDTHSAPQDLLRQARFGWLRPSKIVSICIIWLKMVEPVVPAATLDPLALSRRGARP